MPEGFVHRNTQLKIFKAKKAHRTDIKPDEWEKYGYANKNLDSLKSPLPNSLPITRVHRKDLTPETFYERFMKPGIPVIVEGCLEGWPAVKEQRWSIENFERRFRHASMKVGEDDDGRKIRMKVKYFMDYMKVQADDSPLYLFESALQDNGRVAPLLGDFGVPDIFPFDFFNLVGAQDKPPYRWFCIGPTRSGTTIHKDPLGTNAWNAVTSGAKRWVCMEPHVPRSVAKGKDLVRPGEDDEAIMYFDFILPRIAEKYPGVRIYEGVQKEGDVIFVPNEWWHAVVNLEDTVAITQNFTGLDNFDQSWLKTRKERKKLACRWLRAMKRHVPLLHQRALFLNSRDNFTMFDQPGATIESDDSSSSSSSSGSTTDEDTIDWRFCRLDRFPFTPPWVEQPAKRMRSDEPLAPTPTNGRTSEDVIMA